LSTTVDEYGTNGHVGLLVRTYTAIVYSNSEPVKLHCKGATMTMALLVTGKTSAIATAG